MDKIKATNILTHKFKTIIEERENINIPSENSNIIIYTDGSKDEKNNTGYGYYIKHTGRCLREAKPLKQFNTVFQAEVIAIDMAAKHLIDFNLKNKSLFFFSDSQAAIKSLSNLSVRSQTVLNCINSLNKLGQDNSITIKWIPGHKTYEGNEMDDKLAKYGSTINRMFSEKTQMPHATLLETINQHFTNMKLTRWKGTPISATHSI